MKLRKVNPKDIMIPEVRVTARFDEEKLAMFKESIKNTGQVAPIICVIVDEKFVLVDGLHRLQEAIANGAKTIDVVVDEGNMKRVLMRNIFLDHLRGKTPPSEMRKVIEALYKEENAAIEEIVQGTGLTRDYIEKLLIISELTPMCLEALDEERIGVGQAYELTKATSPDQQEVFLQMCTANHWNIAQLRAFIKQTLEIQEQRAETPPVIKVQLPSTAKCRFCGDEHLPQELASLIICQTCQAIMYEAIAVARRESQQAAKEAEKAVAGSN